MRAQRAKVQPLHAQLAAALRERIHSGDLAVGSALPSEAQLCEAHAVSRGTARHALASLRAEGLIGGGRGKPPVVRRQPRLAQSFDQLISFSAWASGAGHAPGARTIEIARRPASLAVADALGLADGDPVFQVLRLRLLDGAPVMVERTSFVERAGRLLLDFDTDAGSIYEGLGDRGIVFAEARHTIEAMACGVEDAKLLGLPRRSSLLRVRRRTLDQSGRPIEWSDDRYRGDAIAVTLENAEADPRRGVLIERSAAGDGDRLQS